MTDTKRHRDTRMERLKKRADFLSDRIMANTGKDLTYDKAEESALRWVIESHADLLFACKEALGAFENNNAINWSDLSRAIEKGEKGL